MGTPDVTCEVNNLADTDRLGEILADVLPAGVTVSLNGTLGAGKTHLVQAIAAASGIPRENVTRPPFVLCQHHAGTRAIHHLDAYRIQDDDEFLELGVEELFSSTGITIVEWGERVADCLPPDRIEIRIRVMDRSKREFQLKATADHLADFIQNVSDRWKNVAPPSAR